MVKRTITITTILLIISIAISLIIVLNKSSFAADDDIASGTSGTCSWVIDANGELTINPSTDGVSGILGSYVSASPPWSAYAESVKKVKVLPSVSTSTGCCALFADMVNCTEMDLRNLDTSRATNMSYMFRRCSSLQHLDLSNFDTSNVTSLSSMFYMCENLIDLDLSNFVTTNVRYMGDMFRYCSSLRSVDLSSFRVPNVTSLEEVFSDCSSLVSVDLSTLNVGQLTNIRRMFYHCTSLESVNVSGLDVSHVTNMGGVFDRCENLKTLDLSDWHTNSVTTLQNMFRGCKSLKSVDVSSFDVSHVTRLDSVFEECSSLEELDLSNWVTSSAQYLFQIFAHCESLEFVNIQNFDSHHCADLHGMFAYCDNLKKIVFGPNYYYKGNNLASRYYWGDIPYASSEYPYTGKWILEGEKEGALYASELLRLNDTGSIEGTWVWEKASYTVSYSYTGIVPNEASELPQNKLYRNGEEVTVAQDATASGYTFSGWSRTGTFEMPAEDVTITGSFTANTDTPYIVEHYLEDETLGTYTLKETENLTGITDTTKRATPKTYAGYTFDDTIEETIQEGTIKGDGSLVLKLYYRKNEVPVENNHKYKVQYFFDGIIDDSLEKIINAEVDFEVNITPITPIKHGEKNYTLVSNNHKKTISVNDDDNIIRVYYETDVLDYAIDGDATEGDGIPDKYQIKITYRVENGLWDDGSKGSKTDIITLKDKDGNLSEDGTGTTTIPEVGNKPSEGYTNGSWNKVIPNKVSSKDDGKEFIYSYESMDKVKSDISGGKGKSSNPKTDDIVNKYLIVGIGGVLVLALVSRLRRKYSRKAKKVQF